MTTGQFDDVVNRSGVYAAVTVGTSAVELKVGGAALIFRQLLIVRNNSTATIYWGYDNSVTTSTGTPLSPNETLALGVGPDITVYAIAVGAGNNVRVQELS